MGPACRNGFPTEAKTEAGEPKVNDSRLLRAISVCSLGHQIRSSTLPHFRRDSARPETATRSLVIGYPQPKCSGENSCFPTRGFRFPRPFIRVNIDLYSAFDTPLFSSANELCVRDPVATIKQRAKRRLRVTRRM